MRERVSGKSNSKNQKAKCEMLIILNFTLSFCYLPACRQAGILIFDMKRLR